jgi:hypothetical protein
LVVFRGSCSFQMATCERITPTHLSSSQLKSILRDRGIGYDESYDRYDLITLVFLALKRPCPNYTPEEKVSLREEPSISDAEEENNLLSNVEPENEGSSTSDEPLVLSTLFKPQRIVVDKTVEMWKKNTTVLNASDPGTGKSRMAIASAYLEDKRLYFITRATIAASWITEARHVEAEDIILGFTTYSEGIRGKDYTIATYDVGEQDPETGEIIRKAKIKASLSKYIHRIATTKKGRKRDELVWRDLENTIVVFDEPNASKNGGTYAHELLLSCYEYITAHPERNNRILLTGATPVDKVEQLPYLLYVLGYITRPTSLMVSSFFRGIAGESTFIKLNKILFHGKNARAIRTSKEEIEKTLGIGQKVTTIVQAFSMGARAEKKIEQENQTIADLLYAIDAKKTLTVLQEISKARQSIELLKVPTFVNLAKKALDIGRSVIIFVEFYATSDLLATELDEYSPRLLTGSTSIIERDRMTKGFQYGRFDLIIAHHGVGSEGISLQDLIGGHSRSVFVSPTWGPPYQVLKRADRLCSKSDTEQTIVYAQSSDTSKPGWDARVAAVMVRKLRNIKEMAEGTEAESYMESLYNNASMEKPLDAKIEI